MSTPQQLAEQLAHHALELQRLAARQLAAEQEQGVLQRLRAALSASLVPLDDRAFADVYAQTLAYGLFAARWLSRTRPERFTRAAVPRLLPTTTPFLAALFERWVDTEIDADVDAVVDDIVGLLERADVSAIFEHQQDPSIHFYEIFLDHYDPRLRKRRGVYYTPDELVSCVVHTADTALKQRFGLRLGLADATPWSEFARARGIAVPPGIDPSEPFVQILDPSTGTGTFLLRVVEVIHATMTAEYDRNGWDAARRTDAWRTYVRGSLLPRVHGFEILAAPYMVCHLRLGLALERTGFVFGEGEPRGDERLRVYLTDTLECVDRTQQGRGEARAAAWAKSEAPISVLLGNPPYERAPAPSSGGHKAGWIRDGRGDWRSGRAPLEDYAGPTRDAGAGGHLKNLHNLYVYFWRWAGWRVFDRHAAPGIVSLVTASSYLRGPGFAGMREELRRSADDIYTIDLEGDPRGTRVSENVFDITIPVCIGTLLCERHDRTKAARVHYRRVEGTREHKLAACLASTSFASAAWVVGPAGWRDPLVAGDSAQYDRWPLLTDLLPWQHSGAQFKRTWPIACDRAVLSKRWQALVHAAPMERAALLHESRDRKATEQYPHLEHGARSTALAALPAGSHTPPIRRLGFRSFDRQWCLWDARVGDYVRPVLWQVEGMNQLFLTSLLAGVVGEGPAATVSAHVPDLHHFRGSYGGKDVVPLWRDMAGSEPNIAAGLRAALAQVHGREVRPEDIFAYVYAVLANPGYVRRFSGPLQVPGPRLPVTMDAVLFDRGAALGHQLLRWHTYGERGSGPGVVLTGTARVLAAIPDTCAGYPERHRYDGKTQVLEVGDGRIGPVSPAVMGFSVSRLQVVKSWLDYRMKQGAGKTSSALDDIRPECWTEDSTRELLELLWLLEWTIERMPVLDAWLDEVLAGALFTAGEIPPPTAGERKPPGAQASGVVR